VDAYRTVLVGTDGSASSLAAVERAALLALGAGADLVVGSAYRPMDGRELREAKEELGSEAYKVVGSAPADSALADAEGKARASGLEKVTTVAREGHPAEVLLGLASEHGADLVVVGNRGLNSLSGRLLGSVPSEVTHRASCDVLIVHTTSGR
jgi:nucleotide-binding universal stress UspA family protein